MRRPSLLMTMALLSWSCGGGGTEPSPATSSASPASSGSLVLLSASPPLSGSTVVAEECDGACTRAVLVRVGVTIAHELPDKVSLRLELHDKSGARVASNHTESAALVRGRQVVFESARLSLERALPFETGALKVTVIGDESPRPAILESVFPVSYRFVAKPPSVTPTEPRITTLRWDAPGPTGGDCPLEDENATVYCSALDEDGEALTLTLRFENRGPGTLEGPAEISRSFAPSPYNRYLTSPFRYKRTDARITCEAVDASGRKANASIPFLCSGVR
jgi:hypothetical protein